MGVAAPESRRLLSSCCVVWVTAYHLVRGCVKDSTAGPNGLPFAPEELTPHRAVEAKGFFELGAVRGLQGGIRGIQG